METGTTLAAVLRLKFRSRKFLEKIILAGAAGTSGAADGYGQRARREKKRGGFCVDGYREVLVKWS